jgi:TetR/AcrR family transcriptional regulator, lmrAB and yxaGH operons repressor
VARRGSTRQRMIESTITLLRERGAAATTVDAVLAHSGAPRGSVYHHFPGGRRELLLAALTTAGDVICQVIDRATAELEPRAALEQFGQLWRAALVTSDFRAGCPVVALVVDEGPDDPEISTLARTILHRWRSDIRDGLIAHGVDAERAQRRATLVIAAVEGAIVLCRADGSAEPLDSTLAELIPVLAAP